MMINQVLSLLLLLLLYNKYIFLIALKRIFTSLHSTADLSNGIVTELKQTYKI